MRISITYEDLNWSVRIIVGAAVNILLLQFLSSFASNNTRFVPVTTTTIVNQNGTLSQTITPTASASYLFLSPPLAYVFLPVLVAFFFGPLFLSLLLSKKNVELKNLKIVPPFAIGLVTIAYGAVFIFGIPNLHPPNTVAAVQEAQNYFLGFFGLFFFGFLAFFEDKAAVAMLGRTTDRDAIYFEKFRVRGDIDEVKAKLLTPEIRDNLYLPETADGDQASGYTLKTPRSYDIVSKIGVYVDKEDRNFSILKVAYYQKTRYSLSLEKYFVEAAKKRSAYLYQVLTDREPMMPTQIIVPLTNSEPDSFISEVIDDLRGYYVAARKAPRVSVLLVIVAISLSFLTALAYVTAQPNYAVQFVGAIDGLIVIVAVMDYVSKRH